MKRGRNRAVLDSYARYMAVAAVAGIVTVGLRELIALALPRDTPFTFTLSVLLAYCCGIVLNFAGQARFTFGAARARQPIASFTAFAAIAALGAVLTAALSRILRYDAGFDAVFGRLGPAAAFACATLCVSVVSYTLSARYVFTSRAVGDD